MLNQRSGSDREAFADVMLAHLLDEGIAFREHMFIDMTDGEVLHLLPGDILRVESPH